MSTNQKPTEIITGTVRVAFDEDEPKPGKIRIENHMGQQDIAVWPDRDTGEMPDYWVKLQTNGIEAIIGQTVKVRCIKGQVFNDRQQWNALGIEVVEPGQDGAGSDTAITNPTVGKSTPKPRLVQLVGGSAQIDPNQMRIMRQSTLHYACVLMAPMIREFVFPDVKTLAPDVKGAFIPEKIILDIMGNTTVELARKFLEYVISGEMPSYSTEEVYEPLNWPLPPSFVSHMTQESQTKPEPAKTPKQEYKGDSGVLDVLE
jgi:hypothetical protein